MANMKMAFLMFVTMLFIQASAKESDVSQFENVEVCNKNPFQCKPGPKKYWGACVSRLDISQWKCIPQEVEEQEKTEGIDFYAKGGCLELKTHPGLQESFISVCRFATEEDVGYPKRVKCPKKGYLWGPAGPPVHFGDIETSTQSACYGVSEGGVEIWGRKERDQEEAPCEWTEMGSSAFWHGGCLLPYHPGYKEAPEWSTVVMPATTNAGNRGFGKGWTTLLICLAIGAGVGGFFLFQRANKKKGPRALSGGLGR